MAKKIEGYITEEDTEQATGIWLFRDRVTNNRATLVIGDERLFTESEVREFVSALKDETLSNAQDSRIDHVARKVLSLDPA